MAAAVKLVLELMYQPSQEPEYDFINFLPIHFSPKNAP